MINSTTQNLETNHLVINDFAHSHSIQNVSDKIKTLNFDQIKLYAGFGYFILTSIVTLFLVL